MDGDDAREMLVKAGALLEGKFFFALKKQGNVSCKYINIDPLFTDLYALTMIGSDLMRFWDTVEALAAPAVGGIPLLYAAAHHHHDYVPTVWADKQSDGSFAFERMSFAKAIKGKKVLVLEDIVSTGGSAKSVVDLVRRAGGDVIGASFIWNRGGVTAADVGVPELRSLITEHVEVWQAGQHPQWGTWPLVEDIGHPDYYPDYPGPRIKLLAA